MNQVDRWADGRYPRRAMPKGGCRVDTAAVLRRGTRGHWVPPPVPDTAAERTTTKDQACNRDSITRLIARASASEWASAATWEARLFAAADAQDWARAEALAAQHDDPEGVRRFLARLRERDE